jgi:membrane protein implicated in regulation of membrane protease activity
MWAVAGVLLGIVLLVAVLGFHIGPHGHVAAGAVGAAAAVWLVVMALDGLATPLLWLLLGADLAVSGGVGVLGWNGLRASHDAHAIQPTRIEGESGVVESPLEPDGVVRVRGETWSATSLNGNLPAGGRVQVVAVKGVRLEVWGEAELADRTEPVAASHASAFDVPSGAPQDSQREGSS